MLQSTAISSGSGLGSSGHLKQQQQQRCSQGDATIIFCEILDDADSGSDSIADRIYEGAELNSKVFENRLSLSQDLRFLSGTPELCDVMFAVGERRAPIYAVKAVLAIRSRVFYKILFGPRGNSNSSKQMKSNSSSNSPLPQQVFRKTISRIVAGHSPFRDQNWRSRAPFGASNNDPKDSRYSSPPSHNTSSCQQLNQNKTVINIDDFDVEVFKDLINYIHTGSVLLRPATILGLMNAADHFAVEELRKACLDHAHKCISIENLCSLLVSAERYIQYKSTKIFLQKVLEFVDAHGDDVVQLPDFVLLPRHVVELILARDELRACELSKYRAIERWACFHLSSISNRCESLQSIMRPLLRHVKLHLLPTSVLMKDILPLRIVADGALMTALAFQADPTSVSFDQFDHEFEIEQKNSSSFSPPQPSSPLFSSQQRRNRRSASVDRDLSRSSNDSMSRDSGFNEPATTVLTPRMQLQPQKRQHQLNAAAKLLPNPRAKSHSDLYNVSLKF